jgi:hypothetical protein
VKEVGLNKIFCIVIDNQNGQTALACCIQENPPVGSTQLVAMLIQKGADVNAKVSKK